MRFILLQGLFSFLISASAFSQTNYNISYQQLKEYEGKYEYTSNQILEIAASPRNLRLYAIIDDARYPLTPFKKDIFLNNGKQEVEFVRNASGNISGYKVKADQPDRVFSLINRAVNFSEKMWYPRQNGDSIYKYIRPQNLHDGLTIGGPAEVGLDSALLAEMAAKLVRGDFPNMHSVLIIKNNKLVFEEYFYEYDMHTLQQIRSATKTFVSSLVGIAIDKGFIKSRNETVLSYFPEYNLKNLSDDKKKITIENLLNNQSGLDCSDDDGNSPGNENKMYPTGDWVKFILDLPMAGKPGGEAKYCSGGVTILARIVEKTSGESLHEFARKNLFDPLGADHYKWNFKPDSSEMNTFGQLYIMPRDMAKFGLLYLNHGKWNGRQVISENWVQESLTTHTTLRNTGYGYLWWHPWLMINDSRQEGIAAKGNGGQRIYLRPDLNLVVVITGGNYNSESSADDLLGHYILRAVKKK